ncbi:hypothetical protein [Aerophototrophica crusticola]
MAAGRYPADVLKADYLRAGAGLALTLAPFAITIPHPVVAVPCAAAALLFGAFGARTVQRQMTRVWMDETGLVAEGPLGGSIRWADLSDVSLRYYSTKKDRKDGWLHLVLKGGGRKLSLESTLDGFDTIAERVAQAATENRLRVSEDTRENFLSLGFYVPGVKG